MKTGIITHYNVHNHGAHLQLYALVQQLKALGYDAQALQYAKNYDFIGGPKAAAKYNISLKSIPIYAKYLFSNGFFRTLYNYKKRKQLASFRKNHNLVGEYYSQAENLDAVVIGSDEIFSIEAGPNPWYYGIGIPCKKQISYAASFGPTTVDMIEQHNMAPLISAGISNLSCVSVRDQNSYDIVKRYTNRDATIVCDPVLLCDFSEQINETQMTEFKRRVKEKYCIVYSYDYNMNDEATVTAIRAYAKKHNLKVYSVAYFHKWCDRNIQLDPLDVFQWFAGAEMVFTDTFHGSVISLATSSQFVSQIRGNSNKLSFLLEQYGVSERKVNDFSEIERLAKTPIDYSVVNTTIQRIRAESLFYLRNALEDLNAERK